MFNTLKNAWKIPDLRKKLLFTLLIIIAFRFGSVVPVPFLDASALADIMAGANETALGYVNMLTGGAFANATLFAMGITPYINSSIIIQLLTVAIPPLERMAKEGEEGRKKIAAITRYVTVALGLIQGTAYYFFLKNSGVTLYNEGFSAVFSALIIVLAFTAGTALIMWMGEQINQKGVGNGISIILFAGIVARLPVTAGQVWSYFSAALQSPESYSQYFIFAPLFVILFLAVIWIIVFMNDSERRIPVQYAKKVVGRKMYGGQSTFLPIKVTMSGVMPVIFASAILSIPSTIRMFISEPTGFWKGFFDAFSTSGWLYSILYLMLIIMFAYFYMTIQYNPIEMANNLRTNNGTIPGIRPGRPTAEFISKILSKVTLIGAIFLAVVAILPIIYGNVTAMHGLTMGGTSVIIMVGVALETVKQIESQMMMRHYKGFLD
ncbi:MAG: preprotein translocase subunit SecY [Acutalibacteraceae bacterium]|nr:preprotein translocase subunit SecY [Clostridiales bacterium]MEE0157185.1 preprotein translocase subunit SecY [Acutalibacteraceae bacterium]